MPHRKNYNSLAELVRLKEIDGDTTTSSLIQDVLDGLRIHLRMDVGFIAQFIDGERVFQFVSCNEAKCPIEVGDTDPLDQSYCHHVVNGRLPELIKDAAKIPFANAMPVTATLPVGAHLSVPLKMSDGSTYGSMCCFSYTADENVNHRNLDILRLGAQLTVDMIERKAERDARRTGLRAKLTKAIESVSFIIVYQPIYRISDGKMVGAEALTRFDDTEHRPPTAWFDEADEVDLTVELEIATIRQALRGLTSLPDHVYLSVNASAKTLLSTELKGAMESVPRNRVVVELTEHEAIEDYDELIESFDALSGHVGLAIDDVGAGYSSMRHILDLGPDIIKLDISMVRNIHQRPSRSAFVKAMVEFAKASGSSIVAEGVETKEELEELERLGAACAQGYLLGRPAPLLKLMENYSPDTKRVADPR